MPFRKDIFKCLLLTEKVWFPIKSSLKFVPKGPINNIPALVQIMAWQCPNPPPTTPTTPPPIPPPTHATTHPLSVQKRHALKCPQLPATYLMNIHWTTCITTAHWLMKCSQLPATYLMNIHWTTCTNAAHWPITVMEVLTMHSKQMVFQLNGAQSGFCYNTIIIFFLEILR